MATSAVRPWDAFAPLPPVVSVGLHAGFFLTGFLTALLGPLIPALSDRVGVPPERAGTLFVAQFVASSVGACLHHFNLKKSMVIGWGFIAVGMLLFTTNSWPLIHVACALNGAGLGLCIPATNIIVSRHAGASSSSALSILNLVWSVGAASVALTVTGMQLVLGQRSSFLILAAIALSLLIWVWIFVQPTRHASSAQPNVRKGLLISAPFCLTLFVYVGAETCVGGWLVAFALERGLSAWAATSALTLYWFGLIAGRAAAPAFLRLVSDRTLRTIGLLTGAVASALLLLATSPATVWTCAMICGLGFAPIFPVTVAMLEQKSRAAGIPVYGWVFAMAGLGGAFLPWLAGQISQISGSIRYALIVPPVAVFLLLVFALWFNDRSKTFASAQS